LTYIKHQTSSKENLLQKLVRKTLVVPRVKSLQCIHLLQALLIAK